MEKLLEKMMEQMNQQFEKIDRQFEKFDRQFEKIDQRFEKIDQRFEKMDQRLDKMEQRFDQRFDHLDSTVESLKETVENNATEFRSHLKHIEIKLDEHEGIFVAVADEIKGMKFDIEHLSKKDGIHEKEINQIKMRMQI